MTIATRVGGALGAALAVATGFGSIVESRQSAIIDPVRDPARLLTGRTEIRIGRQAPSDRGELGCVPGAAIAFREARPTGGIWAAEFTIVDPGRGDWVLAVENGVGIIRWSVPLNGRKPGDRVETDLITDPSISISLRGPGAVCPRIAMGSEMQLFPRSQERGVFDIDDRWRINQPELRAEADSAAILGWSNSVVKLVARAGDGALLPCSAFFISRHALMTASHCVSTQEELSRGKVFYNDETEVTGHSLELVIVQGDLDFSVVWIPDPPTTPTLKLSSDRPEMRDLVIWQFPHDLGRVVSVKDCTAREFAFSFLEHRCDTAVGTSGAPIQARTAGGGVVALHTTGCTKATNGTTSCKNFGSRMSSILTRMQSLTAALRQEEPAKAEELIAAFTDR